MKLISSFFLILVFVLPMYASDSYFPKSLIGSDILERWLEKKLSIMKEPILKAQKGENEYFVFRILYLPTWDNPIAVRIEKKGDHIVKRSVRLTGRAGSETAEIEKEKEVEISNDDFKRFLNDLKKSGIMKLPAKDDVDGFDGEEMVIEIIQEAKYFLFIRWSPRYKSEQRNLKGVVELYTSLFKDVGFWPINY
jgi:hypothetical protein